MPSRKQSVEEGMGTVLLKEEDKKVRRWISDAEKVMEMKLK
jgi:hypothetical protein